MQGFKSCAGYSCNTKEGEPMEQAIIEHEQLIGGHETRVSALSKRIVEECTRQGFKVGEFELLIEDLSFVLEQRIDRFKHTLL